ncbi:hypothetical protein DSOL_5430 [Desulfosporosinus metallidurans]|uniref:Uncharacterized protein n=1 Tax=Desulfosporosinus metallidurans TaxID=1888891 RepID=A0A1Q8QAZ9_9FIRM|nr:hypothetical protein DSOL_5430 [Desulfosporosinus metallidurans]
MGHAFLSGRLVAGAGFDPDAKAYGLGLGHVFGDDAHAVWQACGAGVAVEFGGLAHGLGLRVFGRGVKGSGIFAIQAAQLMVGQAQKPGRLALVAAGPARALASRSVSKRGGFGPGGGGSRCEKREGRRCLRRPGG